MSGIELLPAVMFYVAPTDAGGWRLEHYPTGAGAAVCSPVDAAVAALQQRKPIAVREQDAAAVDGFSGSDILPRCGVTSRGGLRKQWRLAPTTARGQL